LCYNETKKGDGKNEKSVYMFTFGEGEEVDE
jgi:hypothetical protein